jgi:hypothetical protein
MGVYDMIRDAPEGYDEQVKCWSWEELGMHFRGLAESVPSIDGARTYSVRYNTHKEIPARYWHVSNGQITAINEEKPQEGYPVFDKWGAVE